MGEIIGTCALRLRNFSKSQIKSSETEEAEVAWCYVYVIHFENLGWMRTMRALVQMFYSDQKCICNIYSWMRPFFKCKQSLHVTICILLRFDFWSLNLMYILKSFVTYFDKFCHRSVFFQNSLLCLTTILINRSQSPLHERRKHCAYSSSTIVYRTQHICTTPQLCTASEKGKKRRCSVEGAKGPL